MNPNTVEVDLHVKITFTGTESINRVDSIAEYIRQSIEKCDWNGTSVTWGGKDTRIWEIEVSEIR